MDTVAVISHLRSGLAIAASAALAGYDVMIVPLDAGPTAQCLRDAVQALADHPSRGASCSANEALARMCIRPSLEAIGDCSLVVDCAGPGEPSARGTLLRRLEAHMTFGAVLATDDPSYEQLAPTLARPTQFLGLRVGPLGVRLEALATVDTAPGVTESAHRFCRSLEGPASVSTAA
jgi:3-hydroxyacyl-CoA dehydrogenase